MKLAVHKIHKRQNDRKSRYSLAQTFLVELHLDDVLNVLMVVGFLNLQIL